MVAPVGQETRCAQPLTVDARSETCPLSPLPPRFPTSGPSPPRRPGVKKAARDSAPRPACHPSPRLLEESGGPADRRAQHLTPAHVLTRRCFHEKWCPHASQFLPPPRAHQLRRLGPPRLQPALAPPRPLRPAAGPRRVVGRPRSRCHSIRSALPRCELVVHREGDPLPAPRVGGAGAQ